MEILQPSELLDLIKAALGLESDYKVAKFFGITTQAVSRWRNDLSYPEDNFLIEAARLTGTDPAILLLHGAIWRGRQKAHGEVWKKILDTYTH